MVTYTVHEPPNPPADRLDRAQAVVFLKDGFNLTAAALGPAWLLSRRLWIGLAIYVAAVVAALGFLMAVGAGPEWITLGLLAVHFIVGFEASELERAQKESDGWTQLGSVEGRNETECERRFFDAWLPSQPMLTRPGSPSPPTIGALSADQGRKSFLGGLTGSLGWKPRKA